MSTSVEDKLPLYDCIECILKRRFSESRSELQHKAMNDICELLMHRGMSAYEIYEEPQTDCPWK